MSYVYTSLKAGEQETESDIVLQKYESVMSIEFDEDTYGDFGVLSFRVPFTVLMDLVRQKDRYLEVCASEVGSLLKAIIKNPNEEEFIRVKSKEILGEK